MRHRSQQCGSDCVDVGELVGLGCLLGEAALVERDCQLVGENLEELPIVGRELAAEDFE